MNSTHEHEYTDGTIEVLMEKINNILASLADIKNDINENKLRTDAINNNSIIIEQRMCMLEKDSMEQKQKQRDLQKQITATIFTIIGGVTVALLKFVFKF